MAKSDIYQKFSLNLPGHECSIFIGPDLLFNAELLKQHVCGQQVLIVTNETIAPLYLQLINQVFSTIQCDNVILPDGERYKTQHSLDTIYDALISNHHHRDTTLIALGGGVIGDLTGFAAATYQRGVRLIQLPTTLLAQVDASVGGKTAINHPLGKNMIGSFYQPHAVIMDLSTLNTLPERELRAGFGEIIKYGILVGGEFINLLNNILDIGIYRAPTELWATVINHCCKIKTQFVQDDEREISQRALLNLGHTFAHALETYTQYQCWLHGEAVAIGLYCASVLSFQLGYLKKNDLELVDNLLRKANLPRRIPKDVNLDRLINLMYQDKKIKNNKLRLVLLRAPGDCYLTDTVTDVCLLQALINSIEGGVQ